MSRQRTRVLIVDDEPDMAENLQRILFRAGYETLVETDSTRAPELVEKELPDLVITDLRMPELDGLTLLEHVKSAHPDLPVVVLTGYASVDSAVEAMKKGASDYLSKPFSPDELLLRVEKALAWTRLAAENRNLRGRLESNQKFGAIVGESQPLKEILAMVDKVAPTDARVLLGGESGTGKELIARRIHHLSPRRSAPFFAVNCGAFAESLLESELFGHERGAFTGAVTTKKGIFEVAHGGSLFLDEISETSAAFQTRLLRVVQEGEFLRVGGIRALAADVRIIASSNRDARQCIAEGRLREDLYYRLSVVQIHLPPLRERAEDIPLLASHFTDIYSRQIKKKVRTIHPEAMEVLTRYSWPGNIRELQNVIERAVIMLEDGEEILLVHLPSDIGEAGEQPAEPTAELQSAERVVLLRVLRECNGNRTQAAKKLGIGRRTLYDRMARLGISGRST